MLSLAKYRAYFEVLKPLPSLLLTFIGVCAAVVAGRGRVDARLLVAALVIFVASAGANGITNYLDRHLDARMPRTRDRALPAGRIDPPEKALPLIFGLIISGLALSWRLHPYAFIADLVGTVVAATWRKRITCVYPQGVVASCAPLLIGWFAVRSDLTFELALLCLLIAVWLPLHVWSLMASHREDYLKAGITYFPINTDFRYTVRILLVFSLFLYAASIVLYFVGGFRALYLAAANALGLVTVYASLRLAASKSPGDSWRLYRLSAFPYLGLIFLVMCVDIWL